jgi:hypothetical protein
VEPRSQRSPGYHTSILNANSILTRSPWQKKKLHVKNVIAKVTGQSDQSAASESNPTSDHEDSVLQSSGAHNKERTHDVTARVRAATSSTGHAAAEGEVSQAMVASDVETPHSDSDSDAQSSSGSVSKFKSLPCCRIDFELDSTVLEGISETIGIIRSHFCYWDHRNVATLIVTLMLSPPPLSGDDELGLVDFGSAMLADGSKSGMP